MSRYVPVPVPEELVKEVMRLVIGEREPRLQQLVEPERTHAASVGGGIHERWPEHAEMSDEDVRHAFRASDVGDGKRRRLFVYLSENPDRPIAYETVGQNLGWGPHSLPGVISGFIKGAKSRYHSQRPFRIHQDGSRTWYMSMDERVASIIREEAAEAQS
ncbi:MAG: hypothetical protein ACR2K6_08830 [Solirubrobacterales bacterium]